MQQKVVLIVEDDKSIVRDYERGFELGGVTIMAAYTLQEAQEQFRNHAAELSAVVLDGALTGNYLETLPLTKFFRETGFTGPMIASSRDPVWRNQLMTAGCSHECEKDRVVHLLLNLLGY